MSRVRTGLDILADRRFAPLSDLRVGLVTHPAAVDSLLRHAYDLLAAAPGVQLAAVFGPEHGFLGQAQDLIGVASETGSTPGPRIVSLYGATADSLRPTPRQLSGLDCLVIDLQDIGSRYYTFQATMLYCLQAASACKLKTILLDRPNPLGGLAVEGPALDMKFESFIGPHPLCTRHGMTLGELARLYHAELGLTGEMEIIPCAGWRRSMDWEATGLPWVLPSPNMPTPATAFVYPGQCLIEGTNLSEGRGTTRPFELCGAPGIDARALARQLSEQKLPGVCFRPAWFQPTFQKHAGKLCGGVQLHVIDRAAFRPVRTGWHVLAALRAQAGSAFDWRRETYEFISDRLAIDLLAGSSREREALEAGQPVETLFAAWEAEEAAFLRRRQSFLIYD